MRLADRRLFILPLLISLLLPCLAPSRLRDLGFNPAETRLRSARVELPLTLTNSGLLELPVIVNDTPVRCILDTGAAASLVSPELVKSASLGLYKLSRMQMQDAGGNRKVERVAWINALTLSPDLTLVRLDAVQADLKSLSSVGGKPVDLVLCPAAFKDLLLTIDYPNNRLVLQRGSLPRPDDDPDVLNLSATTTGHLFVNATLGKHPLRLLLDTGCTPGLVLPPNTLPAADAGQSLATTLSQFYYGTGSFDVRRAPLDLRIGRHTVTQPLYVTRPTEQPTLGVAYLQHFAVTLDLQNKRVRFARPSTDPIDVPVPHMPPFSFARDTGTVTAIREGSSAQRANIRVGDRVLSVENLPLKDFLAGRLTQPPERPGHLTFHLVHNHSPYSAAIPLSELTSRIPSTSPATDPNN